MATAYERALAKLRAAAEVEHLPGLRPVELCWNVMPKDFKKRKDERPNVWPDGPPPPAPKFEWLIGPAADAMRQERGRAGRDRASEPGGSAAERCSAPSGGRSGTTAADGARGNVRSTESPSWPRAVDGSTFAAAAAAARSSPGPKEVEPPKENRLQETKSFVDRMLKIKNKQRNHKWIEVFELEEGFDPKLLESKKRTYALRLHPDKVDESVANYCGGQDKVLEAYHFMDDAFKEAKVWLDNHAKDLNPPWERPAWYRRPSATPQAFPKAAFNPAPKAATFSRSTPSSSSFPPPPQAAPRRPPAPPPTPQKPLGPFTHLPKKPRRQAIPAPKA